MNLKIENGIFVGTDEYTYERVNSFDMKHEFKKLTIHMYPMDKDVEIDDTSWDCKCFKAVIYDTDERKYCVLNRVRSIVNSVGESVSQMFKDGSSCIMVENCRVVLASGVVILPIREK